MASQFLAGIGVEILTGMITGFTAGKNEMRKKIRRRIAKALLDEKITIQDKNSRLLSADELLNLLEKQY